MDVNLIAITFLVCSNIGALVYIALLRSESKDLAKYIKDLNDKWSKSQKQFYASLGLLDYLERNYTNIKKDREVIAYKRKI